jgi:3-oxoacyl-[acyl-carrier-protein] synthase-3
VTALLGSPLPVGRLTLRNRVVSPPMERNYGTADGGMTGRYLAYLRARAAGGPSGDYVEMDGRGLFVNAVSAMASSSRAVLAATGRGPGDVDRVVGHQANLRILKMVAGQLNLPEDRLVSNIDRVANTSAASIPLALADGIDSGAVVEGHTVLLTAFGAGLTWGSTVMIWPKILVNGGEQ